MIVPKFRTICFTHQTGNEEVGYINLTDVVVVIAQINGQAFVVAPRGIVGWINSFNFEIVS